jgi:hypothetical protein
MKVFLCIYDTVHILGYSYGTLYGVQPVVCYDIKNGAISTTVICMSVNKDKFILVYHHLFIVQRCSATCFDLQEVIIRHTYKNSVLVLELYFNMDPYYYNLFYFW